MIELKNVEKCFVTKAGQTFVLRRINLKIEPGEFVTVMGLSGAGKSTLLSDPGNARPRVDGRVPAPRAPGPRDEAEGANRPEQEVRSPPPTTGRRALGRAVESILYGVSASNVRTFALGAVLMAAVSLAAACPSARSAARTDPMEALRNE